MTKPEPSSPRPHHDDPAFAEAVKEGVAAADAGRTTAYDEVRRWLLSWGADKELPAPKCE